MAKRPQRVPAAPARAIPPIARQSGSWFLPALLVLAVAIWIDAPALGGGWVWDDETYISDNPTIHNPAGFAQVWSTRDGQGDYYPLTSLVEWLMWHVFHHTPLAFHLLTLALHIAGALLIGRLMERIGVRPGWLAAFMFVAHPANVESVAWISELKNTLSLPLWVLAALAWLRWRETRGGDSYRSALLYFALSLLAKTSGVMLPLAFLGQLAWRGESITRREWRELAPFFVLSLAAAAVTLLPLHHGQVLPQRMYVWGWLPALAAVGWAAVLLLGLALVPVGAVRLPLYPGFDSAWAQAWGWAPWLAGALIALLLWRARGAWRTPVAAALGFFYLNLVPVFAFILLKYPVMVWSMDHLIYLPMLGPIALAVYGVSRLESGRLIARQWIVRGALAVSILLAAAAARGYSAWFTDNLTLWTRTEQRNPLESIAQQNLGSLLLEQGDFPGARTRFRRALELKPNNAQNEINLGRALAKLGHADEARAHFRAALRLDPNDVSGYLDAADLERQEDHLAAAEDLLSDGLKVQPESPELLLDRADVELATHRPADALRDYAQAEEQGADNAMLEYDYGAALLGTGSAQAAVDHLARAVEIDPELAAAHSSYGVALAQLGRLPEAIEQWQTALQTGPDKASLHDNLGLALAQSGQIPEALEQFHLALQADPNDARARSALAKLQAAAKP